MLLLLFALVAGVRGQEMIRSRAFHHGQWYCMRSPGDSEGAGVQLAVCNPKDTRQWWNRRELTPDLKGRTIASHDNKMLLTLRDGREATGNPVEQRSVLRKQGHWNKWQWDSAGRIKYALGAGRFGASKYTMHADLSKKLVVVRKQHSGSKHQAWDFVPYKEFTPAASRNGAYEEAVKMKAKVDAWLRRYNRGRRLLDATVRAGQELDAIEE